MKLLERYATVCGIPDSAVGRQWVLESFYPLPITRYITLHASSGMAAKNYPHYDEVVGLLAHILGSQHIQIVQLGGKDDQAIPGCVHLQGKTSFHQTCYILKNSLLHLGNDSWTAHRAGELSLPLVALYGPTSVANHSPYRANPEATVLIESHRWGRNPTFAAQEAQSTMAVIPPERVANEVLRLLGISKESLYTHQTRFQGLLSKATVLDLIPNTVPSPAFLPELPLTVRMDYMHNEEVLSQVLSTGRRVHIVTTKVIDPQLLSHYRAQILSYGHEMGAAGSGDSDWPSPEYVRHVKGAIPKCAFYVKGMDEAKLAQVRFRYLDSCGVEVVKDPTKEDYLAAALQYLNREDTPQNRLDLEREVRQDGGTLQFRTQRFVLSDAKVFVSYPHMRADKSITSLGHNTGEVVDDPAFWRDINHCTVFFQPHVN
jgi:hypothetical protein